MSKKWTRDKEREYQKKWIKEKRKKDPVFAKKQSEQARKWQLANPVRHAWNEYTARSKRKGQEFNLSQDLFEHLLKCDCHYCGKIADPVNGIDRIDSSKGYVVGNVITACRPCNVAKSNLTYIQFLELIKKIYLRLGDKI